jgi:hypothetical protein
VPTDSVEPPADAKAAPQVPRLCKYRSMEEGNTREYTLGILKTLQLWYSPASKFNDPFDCHLDLAVKSTKDVELLTGEAFDRAGTAIRGLVEKGKQWLRDRAAEKGVVLPVAAVPPPGAESSPPRLETPHRAKLTIRRQRDDGRFVKVSAGKVYTEIYGKLMRDLLETLDQSFGVLCLSERPDDILLWSHYSNSHRGLCLEFDAAAHPDVFPRLRRVVYQKKYPAIPTEFPNLLRAFREKRDGLINETLFNLADVLAGQLDDDTVAKSPEDMAALGVARWFYVKSDHWDYEREWRCLKWKPGPQAFPPKALTRVIVGCVDTEATLQLVRDAIKGTAVEDVPLYKAVRKANKFGLDLVPA